MVWDLFFFFFLSLRAAWNSSILFFVCRPLFGRVSESLETRFRVDVEGIEVASPAAAMIEDSLRICSQLV
jgi:hypothetical protein